MCKNCVEKINSKETKKNNIDVTKYDSKMNVAMIIMAVATIIFCISGINKNLDDFSYVWTRVGIYFRFGDYLFFIFELLYYISLVIAPLGLIFVCLLNINNFIKVEMTTKLYMILGVALFIFIAPIAKDLILGFYRGAIDYIIHFIKYNIIQFALTVGSVILSEK